MANLNRYESGNGRYSQGDTNGNSAFLDPTIRLCFILQFNLIGLSVLRQSPPPIGPLSAESPGKVHWLIIPLDVD